MLNKIRDDLHRTFNALHATIHALLTRGDTLESIQNKSNELAEYAVRMKEAAEEARKQAELLSRAKRKRILWVSSVLSISLLVSVYFLL